jgi:hypothetical protein
LRLPSLWRASFERDVLGLRFPALLPPTTRGWLGLSVGAVMHGGMNGCPAVESLVCQKTAAPSCSGNVAPGCLAALDVLTTALEAGFRAEIGLDFTLSGECTAADSDGNLILDSFTAGNWLSPIALSATFGGDRQ